MFQPLRLTHYILRRVSTISLLRMNQELPSQDSVGASLHSQHLDQPETAVMTVDSPHLYKVTLSPHQSTRDGSLPSTEQPPLLSSQATSSEGSPGNNIMVVSDSLLKDVDCKCDAGKDPGSTTCDGAMGLTTDVGSPSKCGSKVNAASSGVASVEGEMEDSEDIDFSHPPDSHPPDAHHGRKRKRKKERGNMRPNAFVSVRVSSLDIQKQFLQCQEKMVGSEPALKSTMVSAQKLHLTLMVMKLSGKEEEDRAKEVLADITEGLKRDWKEPLKLEFCGVGNFGNSVVYVKVKDGPAKDKLHQISDVVREGFSSSGLPTTDDRPFQSHLTLAKMSAANREDRVALRNRIPPPAYESFLDAGFGEQVVEGLELLSMTHPADEGGYYHCFSKCPF